LPKLLSIAPSSEPIPRLIRHATAIQIFVSNRNVMNWEGTDRSPRPHNGASAAEDKFLRFFDESD
jgi:hypothetical protein